MKSEDDAKSISGRDWASDKAKFLATPSIENFLKIREKHPDRDPPNPQYAGKGATDLIQQELDKWGIEPRLLEAALTGDAQAIDSLCIGLLELLSGARKLKRQGETQLASRDRIPRDSFVDYVSIILLDAVERHSLPYTIPALSFLIRERLGGLNMKLQRSAQTEATKQIAVAVAAAALRLSQDGIFDKEASQSATARFVGIDKTALFRMFKKGEFEALIAAELAEPSFSLDYLDGETSLARALRQKAIDQREG